MSSLDALALLLLALATALMLAILVIARLQLERRRDRAAAQLSRVAAPPDLARALQRIRRSNAELESFALAVSHQLRTPLQQATAAVGALESRLPDRVHAAVHEAIAVTHERLASMTDLVAAVLAYTRVHQAVRLSPKRISLQALFEQLGTHLRGEYPGRVIDLRFDGEGELLAPPDAVEGVFRHLLANAVAYNRHPIVRIGVTVRRINGQVRIEVSDNGPGIASAHHARIFEPFRRIPTPDTASAGYGLGLAHARRTVAQLGGDLKLTSTLGRGSVFTVTLPVETTPVVSMIAEQVEMAQN